MLFIGNHKTYLNLILFGATSIVKNGNKKSVYIVVTE